MATKSKIEWTEYTWNPVTGCTPVSEGCQNCYAARMANRLLAMGQPKYQDGFEVTVHDDVIGEPLKWGKRCKPKRIFVCSMGDLFHEHVPMLKILSIFDVMSRCQQHAFMVLTKRPERAVEFCNKFGLMPDHYGFTGSGSQWPENVWFGATIENNARLESRMIHVAQIPATVKFASCEPLLSVIDLTPWMNHLNLVIVGGETGSKARPMHPDWARKIRDDCQLVGVKFFFKSFGDWGFDGKAPTHALSSRGRLYPITPKMNCHGDWPCRLMGKKAAGRLLDGRTWDEMPEVK